MTATDKNLTLDVRNDEVEEALKEYAAENTPEKLSNLLNKIRLTRVLVPSDVNDKKQPYPCLIKNNNGDMFLPIYTTKEQIPAEPKSAAIMNLPFLAVVDMASKPELNVGGVVINPFTHNMVFKKPLIEKIVEIEKNMAEAQNQPKKVELTAEQYVIFERSRFEKGFLPEKFFENPSEFVEQLLDKTETMIDELYEESYQQKRMYPYLEEEFSVMPMNISEDFTVVRVDFPTRDLVPGCSVRCYMTLDKNTNQAKYFLIEKAAEDGRNLTEVTADHKGVNHGPAPVEGAELQGIIDLAK